jgi:hypothetical protein
MPNWKKVVTSGSDASFNSVYVSNAVTASIFSGSFVGDGSGIINLNGFFGDFATASFSAQATWSFSHNLGYPYVAIEVYDQNNFVVIPSSIKIINNNSAEIQFTSPQTGIALATLGTGIVTASVLDTSSLLTTASFNAYTGSNTSQFAGTASFASTASFITGSGVYGPYGLNSILSASYAESSTNAQDILVYVLNNSGYTISKGAVVHITASGNSSDVPRIVTASYENDNNSANTLGLAYQTLTNGSFGYVLTEGILRGIDTSNFQSGQLIYLGATGSIIGSAPQAPLHGVRLGQVVREQTNNGSVYISINNGYEIDELHDVRIATASLSYGDLLMRSESVWINSKQLSGSYGLTGSLVIRENATDEIINSVSRTLKSTGGTLSVDWENKDLYDIAQQVSLDWGNKTLEGSGGTILNWDVAETYDNTATTSINWNDRVLFDESGTTPSIGWNARALYDINGVQTVDWQNTTLTDITSTSSINWNDRALKDTNEVDSIAWQTRKLYDQFGDDVLIWNYPTPQFYGTASLARTASFVTPLNQNVTVIGNQTITGSLTITNDLTVLGSSSIQYITSSQLNIADNIISVNTITPTIRFGGLSVIDSGSSPQQSGSLLFDSQNNQWIFVHQNVAGAPITSSVLLMGPQTFNNVGNETTLTTNRIPKASGADLGEHLSDSNISDNGSAVEINSNTNITGSLIVSGSQNIIGNTNISGSLSITNDLIVLGSSSITGSLNITGSINISSSLTASAITITSQPALSYTTRQILMRNSASGQIEITDSTSPAIYNFGMSYAMTTFNYLT